MTAKKLIAGNWKMNGNGNSALDLAGAVAGALKNEPGLADKCDLLVCPPYIHISTIAGVLGKVQLGAQDCSIFSDGAYTGDVSASMLKDAGCSHVIVGHSERRQYANDTDLTIRDKAEQAHKAGLVAIICVGETEDQRENLMQEMVVGEQLANAVPKGANAQNTVIAYEPVWAIGTGKTATTDDIAKMHAFIREKLADKGILILYGGSMKPGNAAEILATANVDGGLIGGASLKADDFLTIARSV